MLNADKAIPGPGVWMVLEGQEEPSVMVNLSDLPDPLKAAQWYKHLNHVAEAVDNCGVSVLLDHLVGVTKLAVKLARKYKNDEEANAIIRQVAMTPEALTQPSSKVVAKRILDSICSKKKRKAAQGAVQ